MTKPRSSSHSTVNGPMPLMERSWPYSGSPPVIVGLAPVLNRPTSHGAPLALWALAIAAWAFAVASCYLAYRPRNLRVDPSPRKLAVDAWLSLTPEQFRFYRLRDIGMTFDQNRDELDRKATWLGWAITFTAVEVLALVLAFIITPAT